MAVYLKFKILFVVFFKFIDCRFYADWWWVFMIVVSIFFDITNILSFYNIRFSCCFFSRFNVLSMKYFCLLNLSLFTGS
tara:strand:+ start:7248 stop:7484 length:237 start_codon:yes stop_codon:yes gene_type:complete